MTPFNNLNASTVEYNSGSGNPGHSNSQQSSQPINHSGSMQQIAPAYGTPLRIANGIWWVRLPLTGRQDHVNIYILEDTKGWVLVDTGSNTCECRKLLGQIFEQQEFSHKPLTQVIVTHFHPDHIGLAGWLAERGAELLMTRTCWLSAKVLQQEKHNVPLPEQIHFVQRAGLPEMELLAYRRRTPSNYCDLVSALPYTYRRIQSGDVLKIGERFWTVHIGNGHAPEHATLWSNDCLAIVGDQILPNISPNLSIHPSEPNADLVTEWLESCERFGALATDETLCLPGHNTPFYGIGRRCEQLIANAEMLLNRLLEHVVKPCTAFECLHYLYRRSIQPNERDMLIAEVVGLLNHLRQRGDVHRELIANTYVWRAR